MTVAVALYLVALSIVVIWKICRDHNSGMCDLLSVRNAMLIGFIVFQLTSAAMALFTGDYGRMYLVTPGWTGIRFAAMVTVFCAVVLWCYRRGFVADKLALRIPQSSIAPGASALIVIAIMFTFLAAAFKIGITTPLLSSITSQIGTGYAAVSCGLVGWVLVRRMYNPMLLLVGIGIIVTNLAISVHGDFGRRGLVAVGGAVIWAMFFASWRDRPVGHILPRVIVMGLIPFLLVAAFTSVRSAKEHDRSASEHLQAVQSAGNLAQGTADLLSGQQCGSNSMWIIEAVPDQLDRHHLRALLYYFAYPVPRNLWPNKPMPLSKRIAPAARFHGVSYERLSVGGGVVGHAAAEGGWYALLLYALIVGAAVRLPDMLTRLNPQSPLVVLPVGSALGHYIGFPRGEMSTIGMQATMTVVGTYVTALILSRLLERMGFESVQDEYADWPEEEEEEYADDAHQDLVHG